MNHGTDRARGSNNNAAMTGLSEPKTSGISLPGSSVGDHLRLIAGSLVLSAAAALNSPASGASAQSTQTSEQAAKEAAIRAKVIAAVNGTPVQAQPNQSTQQQKNGQPQPPQNQNSDPVADARRRLMLDQINAQREQAAASAAYSRGAAGINEAVGESDGQRRIGLNEALVQRAGITQASLNLQQFLTILNQSLNATNRSQKILAQTQTQNARAAREVQMIGNRQNQYNLDRHVAVVEGGLAAWIGGIGNAIDGGLQREKAANQRVEEGLDATLDSAKYSTAINNQLAASAAVIAEKAMNLTALRAEVLAMKPEFNAMSPEQKQATMAEWKARYDTINWTAASQQAKLQAMNNPSNQQSSGSANQPAPQSGQKQ